MGSENLWEPVWQPMGKDSKLESVIITRIT